MSLQPQIRTALPNTNLEASAMQARLASLGVKVDSAGNVDPKSLENIKGGAAAVAKAAGKDGVLTPDSVAKLERAKDAIGGAAVDASASVKATQSLKSAAMSVNLLATRLEALNTGAAKGKPLDKTQLDAITRVADHVHSELQTRLQHVDLGAADPKVVAELATKLERVSTASSKFVVETSKQRERWLDSADPKQQALAIESFGACAKTLASVGFLAEMHSQPAWKGYGLRLIGEQMATWHANHSPPVSVFGGSMSSMTRPGEPLSKEQQAAIGKHQKATSAKTQQVWLDVIDRLERETKLPRSTIVSGLATFGGSAHLEATQVAAGLHYLDGLAKAHPERDMRKIGLNEAVTIGSQGNPYGFSMMGFGYGGMMGGVFGGMMGGLAAAPAATGT